MYPLNAVVLRVAREIWRTTPTRTSHQRRFHQIGEDPIGCVIKCTATSGGAYHARWEIIAAGGNRAPPQRHHPSGESRNPIFFGKGSNDDNRKHPAPGLRILWTVFSGCPCLRPFADPLEAGLTA